MDAMEFFQQSAGEWRSLRTTHHLPFRRAETGDSQIVVEALTAQNPKIKEICEIHAIDPQLSVGGAFVEWQASMAWDQEDDNHTGTTVFALIPEENDPKQGQLLRERGYAEIVPVAGQYHIDEENALVLVTEYETMSIFERFWFANANLRIRASTVKRFGGFNTATFSVESRQVESRVTEESSEPVTELFSLTGW
ncbi:phycobiliprotein lyase [Gloeocapsa sp. PCC 73106]|uniref:phycobiliprotein lyase n=1 Tax=Gloeocapsa sp. PCC 73106 TaxID=102232 RepID=UPI0015639C39|nr:phycobiliprotein lyase [Gloeocapsa sp. PCC 73106]